MAETNDSTPISMSEIGARIAQLVDTCSSHKSFLQKCGFDFTVAAISRWKKGKAITLEAILKISNGMNVSVEYLVRGTQKDNNGTTVYNVDSSPAFQLETTILKSFDLDPKRAYMCLQMPNDLCLPEIKRGAIVVFSPKDSGTEGRWHVLQNGEKLSVKKLIFNLDTNPPAFFSQTKNGLAALGENKIIGIVDFILQKL